MKKPFEFEKKAFGRFNESDESANFQRKIKQENRGSPMNCKIEGESFEEEKNEIGIQNDSVRTDMAIKMPRNLSTDSFISHCTEIYRNIHDKAGEADLKKSNTLLDKINFRPNIDIEPSGSIQKSEGSAGSFPERKKSDRADHKNKDICQMLKAKNIVKIDHSSEHFLDLEHREKRKLFLKSKSELLQRYEEACSRYKKELDPPLKLVNLESAFGKYELSFAAVAKRLDLLPFTFERGRDSDTKMRGKQSKIRKIISKQFKSKNNKKSEHHLFKIQKNFGQRRTERNRQRAEIQKKRAKKCSCCVQKRRIDEERLDVTINGSDDELNYRTFEMKQGPTGIDWNAPSRDARRRRDQRASEANSLSAQGSDARAENTKDYSKWRFPSRLCKSELADLIDAGRAEIAERFPAQRTAEGGLIEILHSVWFERRVPLDLVEQLNYFQR